MFFPTPNTVTGEDVIEFHVHGGPAIVKSVLSAIGKCSASGMPVQYAEPGEFTRRAFMNDRLDLTQVEALGDTLSAVTEEQRRMSVRGSSSRLADRYESWRAALLHARGELEALIDFSEDQHFDESPAKLAASVAKKVTGLVDDITLHRRNAVRGELLRNGISVSLIGRPNVGKSSVLNQIVGRNAAIVSRHAGTTRDIVEVGIDLAGFFCRLGDTAGLRTTDTSAVDAAVRDVISEVEQEGIERAKAKAMESDIVILVLSIESSLQYQGVQLELDTEIIELAKELVRADKNIVVLVNKMDKYGEVLPDLTESLRQSVREAIPGTEDPTSIHLVSCQQAQQSTGHLEDPGNFGQFLVGLTQQFKNITAPVGRSGDDPSPPATWTESLGATQRQRLLLDTCLVHLHSFLEQVYAVDTRSKQPSTDHDFDIVLAAESLRAAADCLAKITGRGEAGDVEEVLGVVFEK
ncbi:MAG: mitochondrial splicing system protein [Alyxoria varia]|nr:MAG: mitochondrial splicing system protein [Alyxoria varia]